MFLVFLFVALALQALILVLLVFQMDHKTLQLYREVFPLFRLQLVLFTQD